MSSLVNPVSHPSPGLPPVSNRTDDRFTPSFTSRLLFPHEHGAWGMIALPFVAGALVAGGWANLRTFAATLAVLSVFLLRTPLQVLWRRRVALGESAARQNRGKEPRGIPAPARSDVRNARFSLLVYGSVALLTGTYLLLTLPLAPLLMVAVGAALLTIAILFLAARNHQRDPVLQMVSAIGMTASSLIAYLSTRGHLDPIAFWIWMLFAVDISVSVLVVHARLEWIIASRKSEPSRLPHRRNALLAQVGLWMFLGVVALRGKPWLILPFLPTGLLHCRALWQLHTKPRQRPSMQRIGLLQLSASIAFCVILVLVLRLSMS